MKPINYPSCWVLSGRGQIKTRRYDEHCTQDIGMFPPVAALQMGHRELDSVLGCQK